MAKKMTATQLYDALRELQERQGYFFNKDMELTMTLLEGLLENKENYGYMACPCRLPNGTFATDRDIVCPCVYRKPDVEEFGACYCGLYVSQEWNDEDIEHVIVPERRPPENIL